MSTSFDTRRRRDARRGRRFPAYGPLDAIIGFALFYYLVGRATPTVVDVFGEAVPTLSPSLVRLGLAAFLWFALAVTVVDQFRRQLAALGVGDDRSRGLVVVSLPGGSLASALASLAVAVVFGLVAALTFDGAVATAVTMIRVVATLDPALVGLGEFVGMVVFFVAFGVASKAVDRAVILTIRGLVPSR